MLILQVQAAFAAFRGFVAGSYRNTAPFITPSAAYGLLLNIAGTEIRFDDGASVMTKIRPWRDLPFASIAVGMLVPANVCSLYQQLHNYPVTAKDKKSGLERSKGGKYNIQPVRRELLSGINGYVAIKGNDELERQVREGLSGGVGRPCANGNPRYGVPFLGDNSYLIDRLKIVELEKVAPAQWYCRLRDLPPQEVPGVLPGTCRMTIRIDRADMSKTESDLFAPQLASEIPLSAWTRIDGGTP
jgi:CRISPR-associated protein Cas5t